jgi:WD domain, G-beta repeat
MEASGRRRYPRRVDDGPDYANQQCRGEGEEQPGHPIRAKHAEREAEQGDRHHVEHGDRDHVGPVDDPPCPGDRRVRRTDSRHHLREQHAGDRTAERVGELEGHAGYIQDVAFLGEDHVVSASGDGTAKVWDLKTREETLTLRGHTGPLNNVAVAPDGMVIATAGSDGTAKLWDARTGDELITLFGHDRIVHTVAFSPDGRLLATASGDGTVMLRLLPIDELRALARERVTRELTDEECERYLHVSACP